MRRFVSFCVFSCFIAGLMLGYGVGVFVTATECVELVHQTECISFQDGFEHGYEKGIVDALNECLEAIKNPKRPILPRPKLPEPRA